MAETKDAAKKNKKINRFTADELQKKIEELEKSNATKSHYYRQLQVRRKELQNTSTSK